MISSLHGTVLHAGSDVVEVVVGGVGFTVAVTPEVARSARVGETLHLHTNLIVREDALSLYGFAERAECSLFQILLGVTGVGPKSALGVLSAMSVDQIAQAVSDDDDAPFRRVSGIGPKTAKLIVVQLAGKLAPPAAAPAGAPAAGSAIAGQVVIALVGLGWSERVAAEAVEVVAADAGESDRTNVPAMLRLALAHLGPAREAARG
ncbi:Holliday junction branch migration protein RuvA [Microbacterium horticulturae]|uniref:Holliday junction branch migration complex subunit RuvA n=1 Tax=Microbacterium horticulturae TaxID=3028316 RepID=A0ABY8C5J9_9MICO|nr:Holliday junction branch migration protein RuvA [Microbacterium sp. KACC 23027]WEG10485.1 Holliday junction branch migration protein RuvA [Microbacterium sp. KACC 23027]